MTPNLDLHGKTQVESIEYLAKQLAVLKLQGEQWVTVITGRGHHSKQGVDKGTLYTKVPGWLKGVRFRPIVKAIHPIPNNSGAILVELKQKPKKVKLIKGWNDG